MISYDLLGIWAASRKRPVLEAQAPEDQWKTMDEGGMYTDITSLIIS